MPYTFRQGDLPKLDLTVDRGTDFTAWKSQWQAYFSLSGLENQSTTKQVQALTLCFSRETVTIVNNLGLTEEQRSRANDIITAIERYVQGQINESVERRNFRRRVQQEGETFDDFLVSLRELVKTCSFCSEECTQKNLRDQIIAGLLDGDIVEDLLKEKSLSLDTTIAKCRAHEAAKRQRAQIAGRPSDTAIQALRKPRPSPSDDHPPQVPRQVCPGCGSAFHPGGRKRCPAFHLVCHTCNRVGHLAKVCKSRKPATSNTAIQNPEPATNAILVQTTPFTVKGLKVEPAPTIKAYFSTPNGSALLTALPDSGADVSVAGIDIIKQLGDHKDNLLPSHITPRTVSGHKMSPIGKLPVDITIRNSTYRDEIHIYPEVNGVLLSWKPARGSTSYLFATLSQSRAPPLRQS